MAELKTKKTSAEVDAFLEKVESERKRDDSRELIEMMREITGEEPAMWGPSIIGFGQYHYKYDSGHEGDMCRIGFSPRKNALTLYIASDFEGYDELMGKLGKYKTSKACLYINKLEDVDEDVLREIVRLSYERVGEMYG